MDLVSAISLLRADLRVAYVWSKAKRSVNVLQSGDSCSRFKAGDNDEVSIVKSQKRLRFVIEGKLIAPWIAELRKTYDAYCPQLHNRLLVIDLRNVTSISQEGEKTLLDLMREGARFTGKGVFTKLVLKRLARRFRRTE
jgi:hypothetical protein